MSVYGTFKTHVVQLKETVDDLAKCAGVTHDPISISRMSPKEVLLMIMDKMIRLRIATTELLLRQDGC